MRKLAWLGALQVLLSLVSLAGRADEGPIGSSLAVVNLSEVDQDGEIGAAAFHDRFHNFQGVCIYGFVQTFASATTRVQVAAGGCLSSKTAYRFDFATWTASVDATVPMTGYEVTERLVAGTWQYTWRDVKGTAVLHLRWSAVPLTTIDPSDPVTIEPAIKWPIGLVYGPPFVWPCLQIDDPVSCFTPQGVSRDSTVQGTASVPIFGTATRRLEGGKLVWTIP